MQYESEITSPFLECDSTLPKRDDKDNKKENIKRRISTHVLFSEFQRKSSLLKLESAEESETLTLRS